MHMQGQGCGRRQASFCIFPSRCIETSVLSLGPLPVFGMVCKPKTSRGGLTDQ